MYLKVSLDCWEMCNALEVILRVFLFCFILVGLIWIPLVYKIVKRKEKTSQFWVGFWSIQLKRLRQVRKELNVLALENCFVKGCIWWTAADQTFLWILADFEKCNARKVKNRVCNILRKEFSGIFIYGVYNLFCIVTGEFSASDSSLTDIQEQRRQPMPDPGLMPLPDSASDLDWSNLVDAAKAFEGKFSEYNT